MKQVRSLLLPIAVSTLAACGPDNPTNDSILTNEPFGASPLKPIIIAETVRDDAFHTIGAENNGDDINTPSPAREFPVHSEGAPTPDLYERPENMPDGADVYFFPQGYEGVIPFNDNDRNVVGQIPRSRPFEIGSYFLEAPNKDLSMESKWEFVLNWRARNIGLPPLTEQTIAATRFYLVGTLGGVECELILDEGEFTYIPAGDAYYAQVDCGNLHVTSTGTDQAHRITLMGDFSGIDNTGNLHYGLGGLFTGVTPKPVFTTLEGEDIEGIVVNQTSAGRLASGTVTFYETPRNILSVTTKYPYGPGGLVGEKIHGARGYWGVVEGEPVFVTEMDSLLTGGQRVYDLDGVELFRAEWSPEQMQEAFQDYVLTLGTEGTNGADRLVPGETNTSNHRAILRSQECIDAEVCSTGGLYRYALENDFGGADCEMPSEVCDIAPAAYASGISGFVLPDYESAPFFDPEHPSFGAAYFDLRLLSMTSDAESVEIVSLDGTRFVVPATISGDNQKTFHFDMATQIPSIVADMDVEFGVCFSAIADPGAGEIVVTFCSCEDVIEVAPRSFECPEEEQD